MDSKDDVFLGIDISAKNTILSVYKANMDEPVTISTVLGAQSYAIPTYISKRNGIGQWYFGDEAVSKVKTREAEGVSDLYTMALKNADTYVDEQSYHARDLLVIFFKKLFSLPGTKGAIDKLQKLVICLETVDLEAMELFTYIAMKLSIDTKKLMLMDRRECFYYYALSQKPDLFLYDVALFDYSGSNMVSCMLSRNQATRPQVINIDVKNHGSVLEDQDKKFDSIVEETFGNTLISTVYLVGDGFDGDWMKASLSRLCKGRKVFLGKNLYSKGACYGGLIKDSDKDWPFIYIGDNDLKLNLSIKILEDNEMKFFTLIDAGESWYEAKGECEVIIDGNSEIEFYLQKPESREAHLDVLELVDLPKRENRTTRLRITARPVSDIAISITILDMGFGEISPSSGKIWEHTISLGK